MTDNITLRCKVVWQLKRTLEGWANHGQWKWPESALLTCKENTEEALAALDAALAEPEQKPEPATEAEISAALTATNIPPGWWFIFNKGFRAAERFHGITKEDKT
jgi:hypothetical protein